MPNGNKKVSGYLCGEKLIPLKNIEDTKTQACRNLKSPNFLHRYPKKYRPRKISQLDIQRTPGQNLYIYPLGESPKMKRFRKPFRHMEAKIFIIMTQNCELKTIFGIKKKQVEQAKKCRLKMCSPSVIEVEKQCENWVWYAQDD